MSKDVTAGHESPANDPRGTDVRQHPDDTIIVATGGVEVLEDDGAGETTCPHGHGFCRVDNEEAGGDALVCPDCFSDDRGRSAAE